MNDLQIQMLRAELEKKLNTLLIEFVKETEVDIRSIEFQAEWADYHVIGQFFPDKVLVAAETKVNLDEPDKIYVYHDNLY